MEIAERTIADLAIGPTQYDYPVNYLLDGQQRLSSVCGALYWNGDDPDSRWNIAYDLRSGTAIDSELEDMDERPEITENHELDFSEPVRQEIILAFPMRPVCGPDCPGPPAFANDDDDDGLDGQFAALASLLGPSDDQ